MQEREKLDIVLNSLNTDLELSVYNFKNDTAIIKGTNGALFSCSVIFSKDKALFKNIKHKIEKHLTVGDIK